MTTGQRIKQRRLELRMTVDELADKVGKNRTTIYRYESDWIDDLPSSVLKPLAKALQTTPSDLMGWEPDPSSEESNKSPVSSFLAKKKVIADIKSSATNTYTIHGSQGKGSVVKSSIPKDKGVLAYNEKIYELTQAEFTALEGVIKAMRNEIRD